MQEIIKQADEKMKKCLEAFRKELSSVRTGRASVSLVDNVHVTYYGSSVPLKQIASISTPESKQIAIQPFDKSIIGEIDKALQKEDLGAMPKIDGTIIRIILPPLTEERRKDLVKVIKKHSEDSKISLRNIRRDAIEEGKAQKDKKSITEDQEKHLDSEIKKLLDGKSQEVDRMILIKEKEILEI